MPAVSPNVSKLVHKTQHAGGNVYGKRNRQDGVLFRLHCKPRYGLIDFVFAHYGSIFPSTSRLILILLLDDTDQDNGNSTVVHKFGLQQFKFSFPRLVMYLQCWSQLHIY